MINKLLFIFILFIIPLEATNKQVYIKSVKYQDKILIYIVNNNLYDISIEYKAKSQNLYTSSILPIDKVVKSKSKKKIAIFRILKSNYSLRSKYKYTIGSKYSIHNDNYLYRLPYKVGTKETVTQGFNGTFSHQNNSYYAVDFGLKKGTKIYASRAGMVVNLKNNGYLHGDKKYISHANFITIKHNDGTYAKYVHLRKGGVRVKLGQKIKRGEFIGYSGNTGYTNGAHLHMVVFKGKTYNSRESIPIRFISASGVITKPIENRAYKAVK